jgi:hypothetical protein
MESIRLALIGLAGAPMHILTKFIVEQPPSGPTLVWHRGLLDRLVCLLVLAFLLAVLSIMLRETQKMFGLHGALPAAMLALMITAGLCFVAILFYIVFEPSIRTTVHQGEKCFKVERRLLGLGRIKSFAFDDVADFVVETVPDDEDGPSHWLYLVPIQGKRTSLAQGKDSDEAELWRAAVLFTSELRRFKPLASERGFNRRKQSILGAGVAFGRKPTL